jgi:hypothetical protein
VKPETVIAWHRKGFGLYWSWKSRARQGRPSVSADVRELIRRMSAANPRWARRGFTESWASWASKSRRQRLSSTWCGTETHRHRRGVCSWQITSRISSSLPSR